MVADARRKRCENNKLRRPQTVNIGAEIERWRSTRSRCGLNSDHEMAKLLLDVYYCSINNDTKSIQNLQDSAQNEFTVVESATQRGKRKLVDGNGYTYTVKREKGEKTTWWCSVRNKVTKCPATVLQNGDHFHKGRNKHIHSAEPSSETSRKMNKRRKNKTKKNCSSISLVHLRPDKN
ncbi:hypothetical protein ScPMuIL_009171 [Solemya velum]